MRVLKISHSSVVTAWRERERELRRAGVEVTLVTARRWVEGGKLVRFEPGGDGFAYPVSTVGRHPNLFLWDPRLLWRLLGRASYDVLDIHEEPCSLATAEILLLRMVRRSHVPFVLYSAQNLEKRYPPPFRWIERAALRRAAAVSVCNHDAGLILTAKGLRGQVAEIPLGVSVERYRPGDRDLPDPDRLRVGYVGRLAPHKGVEVLLRAAVARSWTVDLVGGGEDEPRLRALVATLGIGGRVTFAGAIAEEDLPARYATFDVVAVPSLPTASWTEQFGRVVVEAMAAGVPVVASRSGALAEVVGDAGLLVSPGDEQALREAIDGLATAPGRWLQLRQAGIRRAARFRWSAVAADYARLYREVTA